MPPASRTISRAFPCWAGGPWSSGYTWEQLTGAVPCHARCEVTDELLSLLDVLVDGRFVQAEHDISLRFRGSRNQRLLDVPKSLAAGEPVWWQDEQVFSTHTM